jgi:hypothetical protein
MFADVSWIGRGLAVVGVESKEGRSALAQAANKMTLIALIKLKRKSLS